MNWTQDYDASYREALNSPDPAAFIDKRWGDPAPYISEFLNSFLPTGNALEIGAGFGRYTRRIAGKCSKIYAVEPSLLCREFLGKTMPGMVTVLDVPGIMSLPPDLDLVYSFSTMLHFNLYEFWWYLKNLVPRMKKGAHAVLHYASFETPGAVKVFTGQPISSFGDIGRYQFHHHSQIAAIAGELGCAVVRDQAPAHAIVACHRVITLRKSS